MRRLPNIISLARIILSCSLLLSDQHSIPFLLAYLLCGISDVLDGYIARRWNWQSRIGEQLDSLGDFIFYAIALYLLLTTIHITSRTWLMSGIMITFLIRLMNFIITRIKFRTWGMLHTWGNKAVGFLLYIYIAIMLFGSKISLMPEVVLSIAAILSAIEETFILLSTRQYDANRKRYFIS